MSELQQFYVALDKYKNTKDCYELVDTSYKLFFCSPAKRTEKRLFQCSWNKHPIGKWFNALANASTYKRSIKACEKLAKQWWTKSTDTYLFPAAALLFFLSENKRDMKALPNATVENAYEVYRMVLTSSGPSEFSRKYVYADQHTALGRLNGIDKKSDLGPRLFGIWNSAVRPMSENYIDDLKIYVLSKFKGLPPTDIIIHLRNMEMFGKGELSEQDLFTEVRKVLFKYGNTFPMVWKEKIPAKANYSENIFHPIETCKYHFRHAILPSGTQWSQDLLISGLQKAIRRSNIDDALWCAYNLITYAEFYEKEVTTGLRCVHSGAMGKVTNLLNRLVIISAEDIMPNPDLFYQCYLSTEECRVLLKQLKQPQTEELYKEKIGNIALRVTNIITALCSCEKGRLVSSTNAKYKHYYIAAESKIPEIYKKRKRSNM